MLDGDGQHRPEDALRLVTRLGDFDLAVGARSLNRTGFQKPGACAGVQ